MKRAFIATAFLLLVFSAGFDQKGDYEVDERSSFTDRIYFGGGFGLSGGTNTTQITLSPIVGYMVSSRFSVGVGVTYQYYKYFNFQDNQYGGLLFTRMNLVKQIFAYGEYSFINQTDYRDGVSRITIDRLPIGLGISQSLGGRSSLNLIAAYDLLYESNGGYYTSPWVFSVFFSI